MFDVQTNLEKRTAFDHWVGLVSLCACFVLYFVLVALTKVISLVEVFLLIANRDLDNGPLPPS